MFLGGNNLIENTQSTDELRNLARARSRSYLQKSVQTKDAESYTGNGWSIVKAGKASTRIKIDKDHQELLRDKVWTLLFKMDMQYMSGDSCENESNELSLENQFSSILAVDEEISLSIRCISSDKYAAHPEFENYISNLVDGREQLIKAVARKWPVEYKRNTVLVAFCSNLKLSDADRQLAKSSNVILFDEDDLSYYEKLVGHLGPAAKYQFFADMLPGKVVPGLSIKVPAVKTRMGRQTCYTFPISPEYLLKISYVSHRSKGKASDVHTYQRMLAKGRLTKIREYISNQGVFPTNIVVNIDKKYINFQRIKQETERSEADASGVLGWITLRPAYKSAWVIDGQHRLYAYSGHEYARTGHLSVLAFEGITPSAQAKLFVDINAEQKSVKPSLLQELFAELHWDAESPSVRVQAIISKTVQSLDSDKSSPFYSRIQTSDAAKDSKRCISLTSVYRAIDKQGLFIYKEDHNEVVEGGPFWGGSNEKTLERTVFIIKNWFGAIRDAAPEWWDLGSAEGGGLSMNDSVAACLMILKSVMQHVEGGGKKLCRLDQAEVYRLIKPYAVSLGHYFASLNADERKLYRDLRGSQGQTARSRRGQQALNSAHNEFDPPGLQEYLRREKEQTNLKAKAIIDRVEVLLKKVVVRELKQEFGSEESGWWSQGVPKQVRMDASARSESDDNKRGAKEAYFDLMDYRKIALSQWLLFQPVLGYGKKNDGKEKQTKWLVDVNEMRNSVAHASSGVSLSIEKVSQLQQYETWLVSKEKNILPDDDNDGSDQYGQAEDGDYDE
jgi:DNA sulfur modification protein DndB